MATAKARNKKHAKHETRFHNPGTLFPLALDEGGSKVATKKKKNAGTGSGATRAPAKKKNTGSTSKKSAANRAKPNPGAHKRGKRGGRGRTRNGFLNGLNRFSGDAKALIVGTGGAFGSRVGGQVGLSIGQGIAPSFSLLQHALARPVATALVAVFGMPWIVGLLGGSQQSKGTARFGGLLAAGLDGLEVAAPNAEQVVLSKFSFLKQIGAGAPAIDTTAVATNAQTALPPAATQAVANAAAVGAAQAASQAMQGLRGSYTRTNTAIDDNEEFNGNWDD